MAAMGARLRHRPGRGWFVRIYRDGRQRDFKVAPEGPENELKARAAVEALERRDARRLLWEDGADRPLPCDELLRGWQDVHGPLRSERTRATDRTHVERLAKFLGAVDARSLTETHARRFAAESIEARLSGETVAGSLSVLRRVLSLAVADGLLSSHPIPTLSQVMRDARARTLTETPLADAWTRDEAARMLDAVKARAPALWLPLLLLLHTGMRRGEALGLKWEDVNFERSRICVRRAVKLGGRGTKEPKNRRPKLVQISRTLDAALKAELQRQERAQLQGRPSPLWVVSSPKGKQWAERNFSRAWEQFRRANSTRSGFRPLKLHCLRHTYITWAIEARTPLKLVSQRVGCSVRVLEETYAHVVEDHWPVDFLDAPAGPDQTGPNRTRKVGERP